MFSPVSNCRDCGEQIGWDRSKKGRPIPINPDGRMHFMTCPAKLFKRNGRIKEQGTDA